jgi:hypothetical protein
LARLYAFYDKKELAYEWLSKALKQGFKDIGYLRSDPALTPIELARMSPRTAARAARSPLPCSCRMCTVHVCPTDT